MNFHCVRLMAHSQRERSTRLNPQTSSDLFNFAHFSAIFFKIGRIAQSVADPSTGLDKLAGLH